MLFHQSFRCQDVILVSSLTRQGVVQMGAGAHSAGSSSFFFGSKCHRRNRVFLFFFPQKMAGNYEVAEVLQGNYQLDGVVDLVGSVCSLQLLGRKPKTQDLRCWWWWFRPRPIISHCWSIGRIMGENHLHKMESVGNWSKIHVASNWNLWLLFYQVTTYSYFNMAILYMINHYIEPILALWRPIYLMFIDSNVPVSMSRWATKETFLLSMKSAWLFNNDGIMGSLFLGREIILILGWILFKKVPYKTWEFGCHKQQNSNKSQEKTPELPPFFPLQKKGHLEHAKISVAGQHRPRKLTRDRIKDRDSGGSKGLGRKLPACFHQKNPWKM